MLNVLSGRLKYLFWRFNWLKNVTRNCIDFNVDYQSRINTGKLISGGLGVNYSRFPGNISTKNQRRISSWPLVKSMSRFSIDIKSNWYRFEVGIVMTVLKHKVSYLYSLMCSHIEMMNTLLLVHSYVLTKSSFFNYFEKSTTFKIN